MNEIYVLGHKNPDTDSIVAAMAYAALRNALGDREYVAARLGHINDETQRMLNRFGFKSPLYVRDLRTQVLKRCKRLLGAEEALHVYEKGS